MSAARWLMKCGVAAAIVLIACGFATARFGGLQMPATTTRDGTLITLSRYLREPVPDIVLVGSSIAFRLKEEYFATPGVRNLALAGGSPLTGLEIVANQPRLPGVILVEVNILNRATDAALVEREDQIAHEMGVTGVPAMIFGNKLAVSGAREPELLVSVIDRVEQMEAGEPQQAAMDDAEETDEDR